ncbi:MAG: hypothetical protein O3C65_13485, partial [Proteobacteria bacterium]|nr:hypothetical protein [Pseudomonadota bacterium]
DGGHNALTFKPDYLMGADQVVVACTGMPGGVSWVFLCPSDSLFFVLFCWRPWPSRPSRSAAAA